MQDMCTNGPVITIRPYFLPVAAAAPISPENLAASAVSFLELTAPQVHTGPAVDIAINRWTYLWISDPGTLTATATAGAVTATVTAHISSVDWEMGEPQSLANLSRQVSSIRCDGTGKAPAAGFNENIRLPPTAGTCAYAYQWRSLPERTGGTGTWTATTTANWTVTWTSNIGRAGTLPVIAQSVTTPLAVGEWRSELIAGTGG